VFADRYETAFSCCRVLQGLAGIIIFMLSNATCMVHKLIFTATTCVIAMVLYIIMELLLKREHKREQPVVVEIEVSA